MNARALDASVEVRTGAGPEHLSAVRAVAADLAMHADYDLDAVSDLRLAVDEACSMLVGLAAEGATLDCAFSVEPDAIRVRAAVRAGAGSAPDRDGFAWQVLSALTDDASTGTDGDLVRIELVKAKPGRG